MQHNCFLAIEMIGYKMYKTREWML